jgi:hypothetical protein
MNGDLYARIVDQLGTALGGVYDMTLPETADDGTPWVLTDPVIVTSGISDVPTDTIDSRIALREHRLQCEVQALDLGQARLIKEALIAALNGWRGTTIQVCMFESGGPELYDWDLNPPRYCLPVDFMLTI